MSFSSYIEQILSSNNVARKEGELFITSQLDENFINCLNNCCDILTNENENHKIRQLCATIIKNILNKPEYISQWEKLDGSSKDIIKNKILACLASNSHDIRCATSLVIASICRQEIPKGGWIQIFDILYNTSQLNNNDYRISSIITIGYIAQDLKYNDLNQEQINKCLSAIVNNLNSNNNIDVLKYTVTTFLYFLPFAKKNFETDIERKYLVDKVLELLNVQNMREDIIEELLKCLVEISRLYYLFIGPYMNEITNITCRYIKHKSNKIIIQAIEFWCTLTCEEIKLGKNNISTLFKDDLFLSIEYILLNRNESFEEKHSDEWTPLKAVTCLIGNISQCKNEIFIKNMLGFIGKYLHDNNPLFRDSAYLSFGGILEYSNLSEEIIISSIPQILNELKNEKKLFVTKTISWCFSQICENHPNCFRDQKLFDSTMNEIASLLELHLPHKKILLQLFQALNQLIEKVEEQSYITKHGTSIFQILMKIAYTKGASDPDTNVAGAAFYVINAVIEKSNDDMKDVILQLLFGVFTLFQQSFEISNFTSKDEQEKYQNYLCTVICASCDKIKMNETQLYSVYELIKKTFINRQTIYEEGLMACSSLASTSDKFVIIMKDFISFIEVALKSVDSPSICRQGITSTDDLIQSLNLQFVPYLPKILPLIFNILTDVNCDKFLKTYCFLVLSDLFCIESGEPYSYYHQIMELVNNALSAATTQPSQEEDSDLFEYFLLLRERILEFFTCVIHFLIQYNKQNEFEQHVTNLVKFINLICSEEFLPNFEIANSAVGLICDLVQQFPAIVTNNINKQTLKYIISIIKKKDTAEVKELLAWAGMIVEQYNLR